MLAQEERRRVPAAVRPERRGLRARRLERLAGGLAEDAETLLRALSRHNHATVREIDLPPDERRHLGDAASGRIERFEEAAARTHPGA